MHCIFFPTLKESGNLEGGVSLDHGAASSATAEAGTLVLSRSFRGPSSYSSYTCDPQDLLAMNAELSRMAKELRTEMMKMWSFRGNEGKLCESEKQGYEGVKSKDRKN